MDKIITNESGAFLEITEEQKRTVSLQELNQEKQLLGEAVTNAQSNLVELQGRLAKSEGRIAVLKPEDDKFKAEHEGTAGKPIENL